MVEQVSGGHRTCPVFIFYPFFLLPTLFFSIFICFFYFLSCFIISLFSICFLFSVYFYPVSVFSVPTCSYLYTDSV